MISYSEALNIICRETSLLPPVKESVDVSSISGHVCAVNIISPLSIPPFDNTAMDGFAVRAGDGTTLKLKTRVIAGDTAEGLEIFSGECCEIMTGAPLPKGADAVVPVEQASKNGGLVSFSAAAKPGDHIRRAGSDFMQGAPVVRQGDLLGTRHVLPLASLGIGRVDVYSKPRVAFIPTGREIVDQLGQKLEAGQIYNSNLPYALAFLKEAGTEVMPQATVPDDPVQFQSTVKKLMDEDVPLIISSGAVSAGSHDFIRSSLEEMGATILFHKVAIKPGKPVLFARLPNGGLYMGLPGNPVSTAVGLRFFVQPLLAALMQQKAEQPFFARAKTPLSRKAGLRLFLKTRIDVSPQGILEAHFLDGQESYKTAPFLTMNGWAVIPEDRQAIDINDIIEVFPAHPFSRLP